MSTEPEIQNSAPQSSTDAPENSAETRPAGEETPKAKSLISESRNVEGSEDAGEQQEEDETPAFDFAAVELPEGLEVNEEQQAAYSAIAAKHGISAEAASELFALYADQLKAHETNSLTELQTSWNTTNDEWRDKVQKEHGKDYPVVSKRIGRLLEEFGDPEFDEALDFTGAGNHPAVVRMLNRLAMALGEGKPVNPAGQPGQEENPLAKMYPSMFKQGS